MGLPQGVAKSSKKDAECPPTPVCRLHLLCPHPPSSSINMALGWVYSSPSQGCMPVKRGGFCQLSLHILGTTRKYQHLGKNTISMCVPPPSFSYHNSKSVGSPSPSSWLAFSLPVSGNWGVTGPFVMEGNPSLHLSVLPWFICGSDSCLEGAPCSWKALPAYKPLETPLWVGLPVLHKLHQPIARFREFSSPLAVSEQHHSSLSCRQSHPAHALGPCWDADRSCGGDSHTETGDILVCHYYHRPQL